MADRSADRAASLMGSSTPEAMSAGAALDPLERAVIRIAKADPLSSLPDLSGWRDWISQWSFSEPPNRLSNPRLEALKRFAILARMHWKVSRQEQERFLSAGFTPVQAALVSDAARAQRTRRRRGEVELTVLAIVLGLMVVAYLAIDDFIGDPLLAFVAIALISVTLISLAAPRGSRR